MLRFKITLHIHEFMNVQRYVLHLILSFELFIRHCLTGSALFGTVRLSQLGDFLADIVEDDFVQFGIITQFVEDL